MANSKHIRPTLELDEIKNENKILRSLVQQLSFWFAFTLAVVVIKILFY